MSDTGIEFKPPKSPLEINWKFDDQWKISSQSISEPVSYQNGITGESISIESFDNFNNGVSITMNTEIKIMNDDGTEFKPPKNPLKEKWETLYPPIPKPEYSQVCDGYSCIYCGRCPYGSLWKVPEEDLESWNAYYEEYMKYVTLHNPSIRSKE